MRRDSGQAAVYDAEQLVRRAFDHADETGLRTVELLGSQLTLPVERRFGSADAVADYSARVLGLNWVRASWPRAAAPLAVRERAGHAAAHYEPETATLAVPVRGPGSWALREFVVLHELAHHLDELPADHAAHGPEFCRRYLDLVDGVIGSEAAFLLRVSLVDCGVRF